jgi:hypothetical protein
MCGLRLAQPVERPRERQTADPDFAVGARTLGNGEADQGLGPYPPIPFRPTRIRASMITPAPIAEPTNRKAILARVPGTPVA